MPGANYRNSSSGRNERHDKNDERDSAGPKKPLPANIRVAHRAESPEVHASVHDSAQSSPQFAPGNTLTMTPPRNAAPKLKADAHVPDAEPQRSERASTAKIFAKATKSAEKLTAEATSDKKENAPSRARAQRQTVSKNADADGSRCWQVRLTPSTLLTISILLLVTLGFFFLFGLIVGRGSVPPAQAPVLERLTPQASTAESPEQILSEENLRFMTNLKNDATAPVEIGNVNQAVAPKSTTDRKTETGAAKEASSESTEMAKVDNAKYDFVVRAAAFKSENQADDLRARLEGNGIRTRLVREKAQKGTWYHVQILYRGTDQGLEDLRNSLKKYAIKDTIVASRTAVE